MAKTEPESIPIPDEPARGSLGEVAKRIFAISWLAIGGPEAHLAVLESDLVERRKWTTRETFLELFSLASLLPGPTSTQVVIALGSLRAGALGGIVALLVWLAPATLIMTAVALAAGWWMSRGGSLDAISGLAVAAVGLVAVAGWRLGRRAVRDPLTLGLMLLGASVAVVGQIEQVRELLSPVNPAYRFPLVILIAGIVGSIATSRSSGTEIGEHRRHIVSPGTGAFCLVAFLVIFIVLPIAAVVAGDENSRGGRSVLVADALYRSGAVVVGGGQVVLPMLHDEFVQSGWVSDDAFWGAYAVVQAVPGPLFAFSAFLGGAAVGAGVGPGWVVAGALLGVVSLFGPGVLIWFGVDPFWSRLRRWPAVRRALPGAQAAAVGLIVGAFWIMAARVVHTWVDAVILALAIVSVLALRIAPILMLLICAALGAIAWALGLG